ncbi:hypothetical protein [Lapidilactobacillus salsurivasis]
MKPIPKAGIGFKSSLVLSGKAAKDNFTTEPRSPSRLLGRIEPISHQVDGLDELLLQVRWSNDYPLLKWSGSANGFNQTCLSSSSRLFGVTNLKIATTNHGRQFRGSQSIGHSLSIDVSAQTAVITLSGWSGEIRG